MHAFDLHLQPSISQQPFTPAVRTYVHLHLSQLQFLDCLCLNMILGEDARSCMHDLIHSSDL